MSQRTMVALDAATAIGAGGHQHLNSVVHGNHAIQITLGGTVVATAVTVVLEGSLDGATYYTLDTHAMSGPEITAEGAMYKVADQPTYYVRANLAVLTGGTAPTVTVHIMSV